MKLIWHLHRTSKELVNCSDKLCRGPRRGTDRCAAYAVLHAPPAPHRDLARARCVPGSLGDLVTAAHRRQADPVGTARVADHLDELVGDPGPAVARPRLPAHRGRAGPGAGAPRPAPAAPRRPGRTPHDGLRPAPAGSGPRARGGAGRRHRPPRACAVRRREGPRPQHDDRRCQPRERLVDRPRPGPRRRPERGARRGGHGGLPVQTVGPGRVGALADHPHQRRDPRHLPPLPGVRRLRRQHRHGGGLRLVVHPLQAGDAARGGPHDPRRRRLRRLRATARPPPRPLPRPAPHHPVGPGTP